MNKRKKQKGKKKADRKEIHYNFQPDVVWKAFFQQISNQERVRILNALFDIDLPLDTEMEISNTEDSHMNLFLGKPENSRADLIFDVKQKRKLHLEFQSTEDPTIGVRIFVYGLYSDSKREGNILHFPLSRILYTVPNREKYTAEYVALDIPKYEVAGIVYENTLIEINIEAINLLAFTIDDFRNSELSLLSFFYAYRYQKSHRSCKTLEDVKRIRQEGDELLHLICNSGKDVNDVSFALAQLVNMYRDISLIAQQNEMDEEGLQMLVECEKSYADKLLEENDKKHEKVVREIDEKHKKEIIQLLKENNKKHEKKTLQLLKENTEKVEKETAERVEKETVNLFRNLMQSGRVDDMQRAVEDEYRAVLLEDMRKGK